MAGFLADASFSSGAGGPSLMWVVLPFVVICGFYVWSVSTENSQAIQAYRAELERKRLKEVQRLDPVDGE